MFCKKVFSKLSQYSQESTYARVSLLIKLQAQTATIAKKEALALVFSCESCEILRPPFLKEHLLPAGNYMLKVNNRNTRTRCEICSKLTIKTPERRHWRRFGVFLVNFEHISHLFLMFLLLTSSRQMQNGSGGCFSLQQIL